MEGGINDRKGKPIITWEQHVSDPSKYPYVSVAGDFNIWPYGQRIVMPEFPKVVLRVVDTGGHFFGAKKVFRVIGHEPLDVAVADEGSHKRLGIPRTTTISVVPGDNFEAGKAVAYAKLPRSVVVGVDPHAPADLEAFSRMIETCFSRRPDDEARAAAWVVRNRAMKEGVSPHDILAPYDEFGDDGYASTRLAPTGRATRIALEVVSSPQAADPTSGATAYWMPKQQDSLKALGMSDLSEADVRRAHAAAGLRVVGHAGDVELLARGKK